jgi:hypothetical protein
MRQMLMAVMLMLSCAAPAFAHPEDEPSSRDLATSSAQYTVGTMIDRHILEPSWRAIQPDSATFRERNGAAEWVITFRNVSVTDPAHRVLYVMISPVGEYIAANYTGQ